MATVQEILSADLPRPTFTLRPGAIAPLPSEATFGRGSAAWTFNEKYDLVKVNSGEDRIYGPGQALRMEPQAVQAFASPTSFTGSYWDEDGLSNVNQVGTAKGQDFFELLESSTDEAHGISKVEIYGNGTPVGLSATVKQRDRQWAYLRFQTSANNFPVFWFDIANSEKGQNSRTGNLAWSHYDIEDVGGDWKRIKAVVNPTSSINITDHRLRVTTADGRISYSGNTSRGIYVMNMMSEGNSCITTTILQGGATRNADDLVFDVSDKQNDEEVTYILDFVWWGQTSNFSKLLFGGGLARLEAQDAKPPTKVNFHDSIGIKAESNQTFTWGDRIKIALSLNDDGDVRFSVNGSTSISSGANTSFLTPSTLELPRNDDAVIDVFEVSLLPEFLSVTDLNSITAIL